MTVSYKSGAYLIIEHTEALHVVDVNSGNRTKNANGQEGNALEVNLGAADELARGGSAIKRYGWYHRRGPHRYE